MQDSEIINDVKQLFYSSKLQKCIQKVNDYNLSNINLEFISYQTIQLYKSLSYFELSRFQEGKEGINFLQEYSFKKKGEKVDEMDLIIEIFNQQYTLEENLFSTIQNNVNLLNKLQKYQQQNENSNLYKQGIYQFGLGMYKHIELLDCEEQEDQKQQYLDFINLFKQSYKANTCFKQEIGYFLACVYNRLKLSKEQLLLCKYLYKINPNYPNLVTIMAQSYDFLEQTDMAEEYYKLAIQICPENSYPLVKFADFYHKQQKYDEESQYIKQAYQINPKSNSVCKQYVEFLNVKKQKQECLRISTEGIKNNSQDPDLFNQLALLELEYFNFEKGEQVLINFINNNPSNEYGYLYLGEIAFHTLHYDKAKAILQQCINVCKRDNYTFRQAMYLLAQCLFIQNEIKDSLEEFLQLSNIKNKSQYIEYSFDYIINILNDNEQISEQTKLQVISDTYGPIQMRLQPLIQRSTKECIKISLKQKQEIYVQILILQAYKHFIQLQLTFQNHLSHWDIFID